MSSEDLPEEENGYSLKGSTKLVGQLYPVLRAKDGEILDGIHRSEAEDSWRSEVLENIDSEEKKLAARLIANFHRRKISREEKVGWINGLAELYQSQGLRVEGEREKAQGKNEIVEAIVSATGLNWRTVHNYLEDRFKQKNHAREDPSQHETRSKASEILFNALAGRSPRWARSVLERYQKELLERPIFRARVLSMLPKNHNSGIGIQIQDEQLPPGVVRDSQGFLVYKRKHGSKYVMRGKRALTKGEGLPKKSQKPGCIEVDDNLGYFELFREAFPDCQCDGCAHFKECDVAVQPGE